MNILLTGANGFVGKATLAGLRTLPEASIRLALRNPITDSTLHSPYQQHLIDGINSQTDWAEALKGIETVVHLAARVHVMNDSSPDPLAAFRAVNVAGTIALARQAAHAGVQRMVYISSIKVLGESTAPGQAFDETSPTGACDPYGISKLEAEQGLRQVSDQTGLEVVILRPPLVYGPGVGANFQALMRAVQRGLPLPLGAIQNQRSLVAVDNLASAIRLCTHHAAAANQTFHVSDQADLSAPALIRAIATALGRPARLFPFPVVLLKTLGQLTAKSDAVERLCSDLRVDASKISRMLGWLPVINVQDAMRQTVEGIRTP